MGSGPKAPALRALIPPRPLAPLDPPAPAAVCGCPAALTAGEGGGEGGGDPDELPAEGRTGIAAAPAAAPVPAIPQRGIRALQAWIREKDIGEGLSVMLHGSQVVHKQGVRFYKHLQQLRQEGSQELQLPEQVPGQAPWQRA